MGEGSGWYFDRGGHINYFPTATADDPPCPGSPVATIDA